MFIIRVQYDLAHYEMLQTETYTVVGSPPNGDIGFGKATFSLKINDELLSFPEDAVVAIYVMNESGKTIDTFHGSKFNKVPVFNEHP